MWSYCKIETSWDQFANNPEGSLYNLAKKKSLLIVAEIQRVISEQAIWNIIIIILSISSPNMWMVRLLLLLLSFNSFSFQIL
jgi:hypothetical protein